MNHITNKLSILFGKFANKRFCKFTQSIINILYVKLLGLDMREFNSPTSYKTLNELFIRELVVKRDFNKTDSSIISPVDSIITDIGSINNNKAYQIKGKEYFIDDLLCSIDKTFIDNLNNGVYINFYLSPKDYHRYHSLVKMSVEKAVYVPGKLYPVNIPYLNKQENLFIENERVILQCKSNEKRFFLVFVGALNVGKIIINFIPNLHTNIKQHKIKVYDNLNISLNKGDEIGRFEMGSTIVAFFPDGFANFDLKTSQTVKFAQTIGMMMEGVEV